MNSLVSLPIAAAVPTAAPAMPPAAAPALRVLHDTVAPAIPHPDAKLFALIEQFVAADRKYRELRASIDRAEDHVKSTSKRAEMPDVLRWRKSDARLGVPHPYVCNAFPEPQFDRDMQVDPLRRKRWVLSTRVTVKGHLIKGMFYEKMTMFTPSKAARARADEIIAAYDVWAKPAARVYPRGFKKLEKECDRADKVASDLQFQVCEMRATTIDGMLAKVRAAHATLWCKPNAIFETGLDNLSGCAEEMAESVFRDLQSMAMAEVSLIPSA